MKLCCDWCKHTITAVLPQKWGRYHFCSVDHKHYFISGLPKGASDAVDHGDRDSGSVPVLGK